MSEGTSTVPCPYCDFSSGQRGMDTCGKCDGTGRISTIRLLMEERNAALARAEKAEAIAKAAYDTAKKIEAERATALARAERAERYLDKVMDQRRENGLARDSAQARAERALAEVSRLLTRMHEVTHKLEQAKAERDVLVQKFADVSDKMCGHNPPRTICHACDICPDGSDIEMEGVTCETRLLEWAAQKAAKRAAPSCETCTHRITGAPEVCDNCVYSPDADENDRGMSNYWEAAKHKSSEV